MRLQWPLAAAVYLVLLNLDARAATTHYVDANGTNPVSPYTGWTTAATNIQDAVMTAASGDMVLVTNGIYQYGGIPTTGSNRVYVFNPVTVQSVNGPAVTVIKGYQVPGTTNGVSAVRCVNLNDGATLSGFTLTNGATPNFDYGGGVKCASTNCLVTNCVIAGNASYDGGAGAYHGTLKNCALIGNSAAPLNIGGGGGANGSVLINCLLANNFAGYISGGAINSTLINCTVVSNVASAYSGSVWGCTLENSIVYYNHSYYTNADSNSGYSFSNCCVSFPTNGLIGPNNFTNLPLFANPATGNYHLNAASPCINAGNNSFITAGTDLDGNPRIIGGIVDVGAYEFQSPVHYVKASVFGATPVSPFTNWITAATNIQDAIDAAGAGDFIVVSNGIYQTGGRTVNGFLLTNRVVIDKAVIVQSVNGPALSAIQGNPTIGTNAVRCVYLTSSAVLAGFTLNNGGTLSNPANEGTDSHIFAGGGVFCEAGALVEDCVVTNCAASDNGGGVWCESSSSILSNCVITGCSTSYGGGVAGGTLLGCSLNGNVAYAGGGAYGSALVDCLMLSNSAGYGGGAMVSSMDHCTLTANSAFDGSYGTGGGSYDCTLNDCKILNNVANYSAGGDYQGVLINCTLIGNSAANGGGAVFSQLSTCVVSSNQASANAGGTYFSTLNNCTLTGNSCNGPGGGDNSSTLNNCILYYNTSPGGANYSGSTMNYCCTTPLPGSGAGNITSAPLLVNQPGGDYHLQSNSPCINSGNNSYASTSTDLDGNPRIQ